MGKAITKDSVFDSMRRVEAALKLRYMGTVSYTHLTLPTKA